MKTNTKYTEGKKMLETFLADTGAYVDHLKEIINEYDNTLFDKAEFAGFSVEKARKWVRTYNIIINDLDAKDRNLMCLHLACNQDLQSTLEIFNGSDATGYKNKATLRVKLCKIRKIIRQIYNEKYGTD